MVTVTFRRTYSLLATVGTVFVALVLSQIISVQPARAFFWNSDDASPAADDAALQEPVEPETGLPVRLKIPRIRVNAAVHPVGLAADGSMEIPRHARDAAWYRLGPKPGEQGSAVIDGHVNWLWEWLFGATGVFAHLKSLKPGDLITVEDDQGVSTTFVVRVAFAYDHTADASDVFYSYDGKSHLNLITCNGVWDRVTKGYTHRLVVFSDKVEE